MLSALFSCKDNSYTISGNIEHPAAEGQLVSLQSMQDGKMQMIDSARVFNGKYTFKGRVEQPRIAYININSDRGDELLHRVVILENLPISISSDTLRSRVSGTAYNQELQQLQDRNFCLDSTMQQVLEKESGAFNEDVVQAYGQYNKNKEALLINFIKKNINNPAGQSQLQYALSYPEDTLKSLLEYADETAQGTAEVQSLTEKIRIIGDTKIGKPFVDFRMPGPDGTSIALSDFAGKGKVVLIDFWASWCGPCRHEMPNVVKAYQKHKDKGFEIIGVSLDNKREPWLKAIKDLQMTWPQLSDLDGWKSEGAKLYAVNGIPQTILLDGNGIIIAKGLRGDELEKKLNEIMK